MQWALLEAIATLMGCVIGAGVIGLPYAIYRAGGLTGAVEIIILGIAVLVLSLYMGEVVLRTSSRHQLTGYANIYLGRAGKFLMAASMIISIYGALTAYTVGVGAALNAITGLPGVHISIGFFCIMALLIFLGLRTVEESELLITSIKTGIFLIICAAIFFSGRLNTAHLVSRSAGLGRLLLPYGVILFAYTGFAAIPEMREELEENKALLKKAIILGMLPCMIIYLLFSLLVVGISGEGTTEVATVALGSLGMGTLILGNLFATAAMATSFLALGLALKEMFQYDYGISSLPAWLLTCVVPIILFLAGINNFILILSAVGALAIGLDGILIVLMHWRAKSRGDRTPEYIINHPRIVGLLLIAVFIVGIVCQVVHYMGV